MRTRLYRSRSNVMVAGVCAGLGEYLRIDPTLVRLFFVLLSLGNGIGVFVYLLLWIVVPRQGAEPMEMDETMRSGAHEIAERARQLGDELRQDLASPNPRAGLILGGTLILLGAVLLLHNLNVYWLRWLDFDVIWPVLLIVGGLVLLWRRTIRED
jgi:phage shock protein C